MYIEGPLQDHVFLLGNKERHAYSPTPRSYLIIL